MKNKYLAFLAILCAIVFYSCQKDEVTDSIKGTDSANYSTNLWIYNQMDANYLFYKDIPAKTALDFSLVPDSFFVKLLSSQEKGTTRNYFFSYMETNSTTKSASTETSYGYEYVLYYGSSTKTYYYARVIYVLPNSPASKAGLKRGDWITAINGSKITANNADLLLSGNSVTFSLATYTSSGYASNGTIALAAATTVEDNPVFLDTVLTVNNTKVGYLVYNHFTPGTNGTTDHTYDNQLKNAFTNFKSKGVSKFILDLRFNPGGYLTCCQLLSSMILPNTNLGKLMAIEEYNDKLTKSYSASYGSDYNKTYFLTSGDLSAQNINQSELYVICSGHTASASELLINALRPYMTVTLVGTTTIGKNMGSFEINSTDGKYTLHPITMKLYNSLSQSNYASGFTPDVVFDEYDYGDTFLDLGNINEMVLNETLQKMGLVSGTKSATINTELQYKSSSLDKKSTLLIDNRSIK